MKNKLFTGQTLFYLREYFFPSGCGTCGEALLNKEDAYFGFCEDCREQLSTALADGKRCEICGKPLITEKETCLSCREKGAVEAECYNEHIVKLNTVFPYTGKFLSVLEAYKFGKSLGAGNFLAQCLESSLQSLFTEKQSFPTPHSPFPIPHFEAAWVPVPPRPGKIKKQGWDQIEYLAKLLGKKRHLPVCRCLKRLPSRSQKELNQEERKTNLKGRILCTKKPPRTAILFDDVITTGATLNTCAAALLENGTEKVYGICLFYD